MKYSIEKQKHTSYEWGILWMLLSATCLSISFLFLKINLSYIDYSFLLFLRFFIPLSAVLLIMIISWQWKALISSTHIGLHLLRCLCVLTSQYGIAFYMTKHTLLNGTVLLNSAPLFIPLLEWIFLGHRPGKSTIVGALVAFLGVLLVLKPDRSLFTALAGVGLLAALGQAGSQVLYGLKSKSENLLASLFYLFLFTTLFASLVLLLNIDIEMREEIYIDFAFSSWFIFISAVCMGVGTLLNQYFRGLAYRCARPSTLATFLYFAVFVSALLDWLVFKNTPSMLSIIGSCLIILGGVMKIFLRSHLLKKRK